MKHSSVNLALSLAIVVVVASSFQSRSALGLVVDACRINSRVTGSPFPCIKVVELPSPLSSYAILREPDDKERTILAPLADIPGTEDPRLVAPGGPNFFGAAWKERSIEIRPRASSSFPAEFALAVNPATWRTQDRLHVHIGCTRPRFRALLKSHELDISRSQFTKLRNSSGLWARFYSAKDPSEFNPIQAVASGVGDAKSNMAHFAIGVFDAVLSDGQRGFYVLASLIGKGRVTGSAEDMIDPKCRL